MTEEWAAGQGLGTSVEIVEKPPKNFLRDFFGIIFDPTKAFKNIIPIGYWVLIFLVILLAECGLEQVYHSQVINLTLQKMQEQAGGNPAQMQAAMQFYQNPAITRPMYFVFTALGNALFLLIIAVLSFFACTVILGGTAKFKQVWVVTCWAYIIMLLAGIVKTPLILAKNSVQAGLNFGLIFTENMVGTKLHSFFGAFDIFGIWHFIVMGIGLAILYKFTVKKGVGISFVIWLLMTIVGGIAAYFSA